MQTEHLTVNGMSCDGCVTRVTEALKAVPGVGAVDVTLSTGKIDVTYDDRLAGPAQIIPAVEGAGYSVGATQADVAAKSKGCCC